MECFKYGFGSLLENSGTDDIELTIERYYIGEIVGIRGHKIKELRKKVKSALIKIYDYNTFNTYGRVVISGENKFKMYAEVLKILPVNSMY